MKQVLCAHLPHWPTDRLRRRRPELRRKPFVLVDGPAQGRRIIAEVSPDVPADIRPGMSLAEARARHADLTALAHAPAEDAAALRALGRWMMRFSPCVAVYPPRAIFLDATGLEPLMGSLEQLRQRVAAALAAWRIGARVVIAPAPGAAWALAAFAAHPPGVVGCEAVMAALAPPAAGALRLEPAAALRLRSLDIRTVKDVLQLPRDDLAARFGADLLRRIDQATGALHEPLVFLPHGSAIAAALEFDGTGAGLEVLHLALRQLVERVADELGRRGLGARELRLTVRRPYAQPLTREVRLTRPSRNAAVLGELLRCACESFDAENISAVELAVSSAQRLGHEQAALLGDDRERGAAEVDQLVQRLRARLGEVVAWAQLVEAHLPERAFRYCSAPSASGGTGGGGMQPTQLLSAPRAVQVMVAPSENREPVSFTDGGQVHRLAHVRGPQRIAGPWWEGRGKIRDYFDVLDSEGARFWLFRVVQTQGWFLHGIFA